MRVTFALLADFALAHPDGKLYVTGGGLHQLVVGQLPALHPRISLALEVEFAPSERGSAHTVVIQAVDPTGESFIKPALLSVALAAPTIQVAPPHTQLVYNMQNLTFHREGEYVFSVSIGGQEQARLPLRVTLVPGSSTELSTLLQLLQEGFTAFGAKDLENAEQRFRAVIEAMPSLGVAHNNLGFVLLAKGQVEDALAAFNRSEEVGFERPELVEANIACCHYLLGNTAASFALFENCLNARSFTSAAILNGISGDRLFIASLPSAGAYTQLMALNAAWSALRAGKPEIAKARAAMAAGLVGIASDQALTDALEELKAEIRRGNAPTR